MFGGECEFEESFSAEEWHTSLQRSETPCFKKSLTSPAIVTHFGLATAIVDATGSTVDTSTDLLLIFWTTTLQGSIVPIMSSFRSALCANVRMAGAENCVRAEINVERPAVT